MLRAALLALIALLAVAAPAAAQAPSLEEDGFEVTWPNAAAAYPGARVAVSATGRTAGLTAQFYRVRADGRRIGRLATRRTRAGRWSAVLPNVVGARFVAVLRRGEQQWTGLPTRVIANECRAGAAPVMTIDRTTFVVGEQFALKLHNPCAFELSHGACNRFERWNGTGWERAGRPNTPCIAVAYRLLPGQTTTVVGSIWPGLAPGRHRAVMDLWTETPLRPVVERAVEIQIL